MTELFGDRHNLKTRIYLIKMPLDIHLKALNFNVADFIISLTTFFIF